MYKPRTLRGAGGPRAAGSQRAAAQRAQAAQPSSRQQVGAQRGGGGPVLLAESLRSLAVRSRLWNGRAGRKGPTCTTKM